MRVDSKQQGPKAWLSLHSTSPGRTPGPPVVIPSGMVALCIPPRTAHSPFASPPEVSSGALGTEASEPRPVSSGVERAAHRRLRQTRRRIESCQLLRNAARLAPAARTPDERLSRAMIVPEANRASRGSQLTSPPKEE
jgi:hypothetical protein